MASGTSLVGSLPMPTLQGARHTLRAGQLRAGPSHSKISATMHTVHSMNLELASAESNARRGARSVSSGGAPPPLRPSDCGHGGMLRGSSVSGAASTSSTSMLHPGPRTRSDSGFLQASQNFFLQQQQHTRHPPSPHAPIWEEPESRGWRPQDGVEVTSRDTMELHQHQRGSTMGRTQSVPAVNRLDEALKQSSAGLESCLAQSLRQRPKVPLSVITARMASVQLPPLDSLPAVPEAPAAVSSPRSDPALLPSMSQILSSSGRTLFSEQAPDLPGRGGEAEEAAVLPSLPGIDSLGPQLPRRRVSETKAKDETTRLAVANSRAREEARRLAREKQSERASTGMGGRRQSLDPSSAGSVWRPY
jgi:hypothetical protein